MSTNTKEWDRMDAAERLQHAIFRVYVTHPVIGQLSGFYRHLLAVNHEVTLETPIVVPRGEGKEPLKIEKINLTQVPTACTDGQSIWYNPTFVMKCTKVALCFLVLHEAMHNILAHHIRRDGREPERWNIAIDGAINQILMGEFFGAQSRSAKLADKFQESAISTGVDLHGLVEFHGCDAAKVTDASAEVIYAQLKAAEKNGGGKGKGKKGGCLSEGEPTDEEIGEAIGDLISHALSEALSNGKLKKDNKTAQEGANDQLSKVMQVIQNTREIGKFPAALMKMVQELVEPKVDYAAVLRAYLSKETVGDYGFARPSRRQESMPDYVILPGAGRIPGSGSFVVAFDTSGSIYGCQKLVEEMMTEVYGIQRDTESELLLIYCDSAIPLGDDGQPAVHYFGPSETVRDVVDHRVKPVGGGGTSFVPPFEYLDKHGIQPDAFIYFTDLAGVFPTHAPNYPVIWITFEKDVAPFGKTINVKRSGYEE